MANKNARLRYAVIDRLLCVRPNKYPTLQEIADKCSSRLGKTVTTDCIEKDIRRLREGDEAPDYPIAPIEYSHKNKGYYYKEADFSLLNVNLSEPEWESLRYAALLLYQHKNIPIFGSFQSAIERINNTLGMALEPDESLQKRYVQFENAVSDKGLQWMPELYRAVSNQWEIHFKYENVYKKTVKEYRLVPYLLKESRNRWYLIGWVADRSDYLTFALDRIQTVHLVQIKQPLRNDFDVDRFLQHSIGITRNNGKPTDIKLSIKPPFDRLVELEPLHLSQQIIKRTKSGIEVRFTAYINDELCLRILGLGPYCQVKSPKALVETIRKQLKQTLQHYSASKRS
jgi:predicted DNA-binding transcriptional regulator YafY